MPSSSSWNNCLHDSNSILGDLAGPASTHLCFSKGNYSVGREKRTLLTGKYDYSIQSCHLMCFNTQSVLQHPESLHYGAELMRSICICCHYSGDIIYLPCLTQALRWPMKVQTQDFNHKYNFEASPRFLLIAMWLASLLVPRSLPATCLSTLEAGLLP